MTVFDYYYEHLAHVFGTERATEIIDRAKLYTDGKESDHTDEFQTILENSIYPLIGIYRSMILEDFTEHEVSLYLKALWDIAPDSIRLPPKFPKCGGM